MAEHDIVIYGAGSIGSSVGGWLAPHCPGLSLLSRGDHAAAMKKNGLAVSLKGQKGPSETVAVPVITDLAERPDADIVILAVKNYDLESAAADIKKKLKREPLIVALQNGIENQQVLPRFFSRVVYGVVCYNSWREAPGAVRANNRGPIILGVRPGGPDMARELGEAAGILSRGLSVRVTDNLPDTVMTKMIVNLNNAVLTLVGHGKKEIRSARAVKRIMTGSMREGFEIARRMGFGEVPIPGAPSRTLLRLMAALPEFISDFLFSKNLAAVDINSMGQDVLQFGRDTTEIESLTGYFVRLADELGMPAPYNRTVYALAKKRFAERPFVPMDETEVWEEIERRIEECR